jgi:DNA-binding transcriptional ArsR family regulator
LRSASREIEASRDYDRSMYADADLASVGALLAEPARAKVLMALGDGRSLPASMLAAEAGVAASTASHHLSRLVDGGLLTIVTRGRHRYFTLAGPQVAELLEAVARVAPTRPVTSLREGTRAHALRACVDWTEQRPHVAGALGQTLLRRLLELEWLQRDPHTRAVRLTDAGHSRLPAELGVVIP